MILRNLPQGDRHVAAEPGFRGQQIIEAGVTTVFGDVVSDGKEIPHRIIEKGEIHRRHLITLPCQISQGFKALPGPAAGFAQTSGQFVRAGSFLHPRAGGVIETGNFPQGEKRLRTGGPRRRGSCHQRGGRQGEPWRDETQILQVVPAIPLQGRAPRHHFIPVVRDVVRQPDRQNQGFLQNVMQGRQGGWLPVQHRFQLRQHRMLAGQAAEDPRGVAQAGEDLRTGNFFGAQSPQSRSQSEEVSGQVATVHAGDVERIEAFKGPGVVPVIEMPAIALQPLHRAKGILGAFDQTAHRQITKVPGRQIGQQGEAHIGGRGARGDHWDRHLLVIVRRQPVFLRGDEGIKKVPGPAGGASQKDELLIGQIGSPGFNRLADPPRNPRSRRPEH